jgi:hypothetical protein
MLTCRRGRRRRTEEGEKENDLEDRSHAGTSR